MQKQKIFSASSKKASRFSRKILLLFILVTFFLGGWSGYEIHEELVKKGCLVLPNNVVSTQVPLESQDTVKFIAMGDTGTGNADDIDQKQVALAVQRVCEVKGCDFILLMGDNIYPKGVTSLEDPQFQTAFEIPYAEIDKPFFLVLGNHDTKGDALSQVIYSLKSTRWRMPNFSYEFTAGPVHFFAINTVCSFLPWYGMQDLLETSQAPWNFVFGHHSIYSSGTHGDIDLAAQWFWQQFLQEDIDFFLSGHNHQLEHLQIPEDSTEYISSGAGGKHYRSPSEREKTQPSDAETLFVYQDIGFAWFEVTPLQVQMTFFDGQARELYQLTKQKDPSTTE